MAAQTRQAALDAVGRAMQRQQRSTQSFDDAVGRRWGLGPADLRCLDHLSERPHTAGELARAAGLRPAATTALIDRLEGRGLVARTPSPTDRRRVVVALTAEAGRLVRDAYGPLVAEGTGLLDGFTTRELGRMTELLDRMTDLMDRHRARVAGEPPVTPGPAAPSR